MVLTTTPPLHSHRVPSLLLAPEAQLRGLSNFLINFFVHKSCNLKCQTDQSEDREPNGEKVETNQKSVKRKTRGIAQVGWVGWAGHGHWLCCPVV